MSSSSVECRDRTATLLSNNQTIESVDCERINRSIDRLMQLVVDQAIHAQSIRIMGQSIHPQWMNQLAPQWHICTSVAHCLWDSIHFLHLHLSSTGHCNGSLVVTALVCDGLLTHLVFWLLLFDASVDQLQCTSLLTNVPVMSQGYIDYTRKDSQGCIVTTDI